MKRSLKIFSLLCSFLLLTACEEGSHVVSNLGERDANIIVVFLESKGIKATKVEQVSSAMAGEGAVAKFSVTVPSSMAVQAMAILNQNGLPQQKGAGLLDLFSKQGLMSSDREESVRYQAGLSQQVANTILMIDGVIDCSVQISFPEEAGINITGQETLKNEITAAVYVKHQGVFDDPNSHLEMKIKRLVSGSVTGLSINNVTVVSDRSRFTDVSLSPLSEQLSPRGKEFVKVWSIVMSRESVIKFRFIFFIITTLLIVVGIVLSLVIWRLYPLISSQGGISAHLFKRGKRHEASEQT